MAQEGALKRGDSIVYGVLAELLSTLEGTITWKTASNGAISIDEIVALLDTSVPAEERVEPTNKLIRRFQAQRKLAAWIPWYEDLPSHEFGGEFHHAYRDHTIHSLQLFLLGLYLFETVGPLRNALESKLGNVGDSSADLCEAFVEWWVLSSLWHDMAYPLEATRFITDVSLQKKILSRLSNLLNEQVFLSALARGGTLTMKQRREAYRLGGHVAFEFESAGDLLGGKADQTISDMWGRLGTNLELPSITQEINRITTSASLSRPPYHDHGLMGALLLGYLHDETYKFIDKLIETSSSTTRASLPPNVWAAAERGWEDFVQNENLVRLAVESIAFHNINWRQFDRKSLCSIWPEDGPLPAVKLAAEPHLFFTAIADTLQDWDRHHFAPRTEESAYRPTVSSRNMLLQGTGDKLRVGIRGTPDAVSRVAKLFKDWLHHEDIASLLAGDPKFSYPAKVEVADYVTVSGAEMSHRERDRLVGIIKERAAESRRLLISNDGDAIVRVSQLFSSIHRQVNEAKKTLTKSDQDAVEHALGEGGLKELEALAHSMVRDNRKLSRGVVQYRIGQGGFGSVYCILNDDPSSGRRQLAFKLYNQDALNNEEKRRLFKRGYDAMQALQDHPNVVDVIDYTEIPLGFYMSYIDGPDLEAGRNKLVTPFDQLRVATEIAETLADAHERNIYHRDVKPGNVLLAQRGNKLVPILTDFDLAWIEGQTQTTQQAFANMHYGAPEQFEERWAHFRRSPTVDIYALGALTYYLLLGTTPPYCGSWKDSNWDVFQQRLVDQLPAVVVRKLMKLLKKMTEHDPRNRIKRAEDVVIKMNEALAQSMSNQQEIDLEAFREQIGYKLTDGSLAPDSGFIVSPAGNLRWQIDLESKANNVNLIVRLELLGDPRFENVNHEEFRSRAMKLIDGRLQSFKGDYPEVRAHRVGALSKAKATELRIDNAPRTLVVANALGRLLSSIGRAIQ
jgi:serine/threonine-protein kinase